MRDCIGPCKICILGWFIGVKGAIFISLAAWIALNWLFGISCGAIWKICWYPIWDGLTGGWIPNLTPSCINCGLLLNL